MYILSVPKENEHERQLACVKASCSIKCKIIKYLIRSPYTYSYYDNFQIFNACFSRTRRAEVLEVFRERDRDQDGRMSFEEFSGQKTRSEIAFGAIDKNGDGFVSRYN